MSATSSKQCSQEMSKKYSCLRSAFRWVERRDADIAEAKKIQLAPYLIFWISDR
jgi:hypothetical protein